MNWTVTEKDVNSHQISMKYAAGFRQRVLLRADAHHDNPKTDWDLEEKHLKQAKEFGAPIIDAGDLFCAMQGKYDKRSSKEDVRPEHMKGSYLDALVHEASGFYAPYAENFAVIGEGNHDRGIYTRHETDLVQRLCHNLKCYRGGYRGVVRFLFEHEAGGRRSSHTLFYTHGSGGGGQVSRGTTKSPRRAVYMPDADIVLSGHIHEAYYMEIPRWRVLANGRIVKDTQYHIQTPTYKDEFKKVGKGWVDTMEMPPKPLGAWWLTFFYEEGQIKMTFERAI